MTDQPEQENVEEIRKAHQEDSSKPVLFGAEQIHSHRFLLLKEIDRLASILSAAEKRAETAKRQLGECSGGYETLEKELATALVVAQNYQSLMVTAQRERDEARASLSRMWEALKPFAVCAATFEEDTPDSFPLFSFNEADEIEELEIELGDLRKARALHRSQG